MKIARVETIPVVLEAPPFHSTYGTVGNYANVIVRITNDSGLVGIGEASPWVPRELGETQDTVDVIVRRFLGPVLIGEDPFKIALLLERMDGAILGYPIAKAAVEMALYDLIGKAVERPVYDLLGGAFRTSFPTFGSVVVENRTTDLEQMADEAARVAKGGHTTIKVKVISATEEEPVRTIERIRLIRKAVGPNVRLIIDPNQGWLTAGLAISIMRHLEAFDIYVEQPIPRGDYAGMAQIAQTFSIPLIADESVFTPQGLLEVARLRTAHIVNIKLTRPGGFWRAHRMVSLAETLGFQCEIDDVAASRITTTATAHLACAVSDRTFFGYAVGLAHQRIREDIVGEGGITLDGATVGVPAGAGLGIELDEQALSRAVDRARALRARE
jgi:L-alanine-DL-glutamate epimerase-like enolase superfamily enzyme